MWTNWLKLSSISNLLISCGFFILGKRSWISSSIFMILELRQLMLVINCFLIFMDFGKLGEFYDNLLCFLFYFVLTVLLSFFSFFYIFRPIIKRKTIDTAIIQVKINLLLVRFNILMNLVICRIIKSTVLFRWNLLSANNWRYRFWPKKPANWFWLFFWFFSKITDNTIWRKK